jgi:hypothetical protein
MLGNTFVLDGTVDITVTRINQDAYGSEYRVRDSLSETTLKIRHSTVKATATAVARDRHNVEITQKIFATSTVPEFIRKAYVVYEHKPGDTDLDVWKYVCAFCTATSFANMTALMNWES